MKLSTFFKIFFSFASEIASRSCSEKQIFWKSRQNLINSELQYLINFINSELRYRYLPRIFIPFQAICYCFQKSQKHLFSRTPTLIRCQILWKTMQTLCSSVIRQKGESQNGCYKKTKDAKNYEKQTFLTPLRTRICAYQGVRNDRFSENLTCFAFLYTCFEIRPFALLPTSSLAL